jgi:hypothetical protein
MLFRVPSGQTQPQKTLQRRKVTEIRIRERKKAFGICPPCVASRVVMNMSGSKSRKSRTG